MASVEPNTNLIVNYLPQTMTDMEFRSLFLNIGPLKSCKVIRHLPSNYSFGYGFADYVNETDAARAVEQLNGMQLGNKRLKVAHARPSSEKIKNSNLYVKGIPKTWTREKVEEVFKEFGEVIQCRVLGNQGQDASFQGVATKGTAFVLYASNEQAEAAIAAMDGKTLDDEPEPLSMKFADDNQKKIRPPAQNMNNPGPQQQRFPNFNNMMGMRNNGGFNGGFGNQNMFNNYGGGGYGGGPMRNVNGPQNRYNPMNGGPNGPMNAGTNNPMNVGPNGPMNTGPNGSMNAGPNGSMNAGPNGSMNAGPNGSMNAGPNRSMSAGPNGSMNAGPNGSMNVGPNGSMNAGPNGQMNAGPNVPMNVGSNGPEQSQMNQGSGQGQTLFVYNIGQFTDEKTLWGLFLQYGQVTKVNIIRDSSTGVGKGFGFVTMPVHQEAQWAIENCNGFKMNGRSLQVSFKTQK